VLESLDKAWKILGKIFVECDTRQRSLGELYIDNDLFVEYFCQALGKDFFAECHLVLGKEKSPSRRQMTETLPIATAHRDDRQQ
jgi:hypothetical protein